MRRIARGSAYELLDHLITRHDQGSVKDVEYSELRGLLMRFVQLVNEYIRSIGKGDKDGKPLSADRELSPEKC